MHLGIGNPHAPRSDARTSGSELCKRYNRLFSTAVFGCCGACCSSVSHALGNCCGSQAVLDLKPYGLTLVHPVTLTRSLTDVHSVTHSLAHSLTRSRTFSITHSLSHRLTHSLTYLFHSLTHSRTHSHTHSLTHSAAPRHHDHRIDRVVFLGP